MSKFLYPIYKLKTKSYIKWWLYHKKAGGSGVLSEILEGFSFNLANTLNRKFNLFEIEGNSVQNGTPSPDNEQPIESAGENIQLFDKTTVVTNKYINNQGEEVAGAGFDASDFISVNPNTNIVLSGNNFIQSTHGAKGAFYNINKEFVSYVNIAIGNNVYAVPNTARYFRFSLKPNDLDIIKVEKGNKASGYSPYGMGSINEKITNSDGTKEQDYSIFVQQPMRSIGDIRDCFVKVNGNWYERHYIARKIFDGTEQWTIRNNGDGSTTMSFNLNVSNLGSINFICNKFQPAQSSTNGKEGIAIASELISMYIQIKRERLSSVDVAGFKTWLAEQYANGTPVYIDYPLATPSNLPCTEEQIEILENLPSTYKDFTIIQSEDTTPAHLKIQYYKEG